MTSTASSAAAVGAPAAELPGHHAGMSILELCAPRETQRAAELLREIWGGSESPVPANVLLTVQHTGGYVFGVYDSAGVLVAVSLGLLATSGQQACLHSHITGVLPSGQRQGLGLALKQHQRSWALQHGLETITWTCDPLVRRNVAFNLQALGAVVTGYLPDHYGKMSDGVNRGDASDRIELRWELLSVRATEAAQGRLPALPAAGLPYAVQADEHGLPVLTPRLGRSHLVQLPADVEALRRADPSAGAAWRRAIRASVLPALSQGAVVQGLTAEGALVLEVSS